MAHQGVPGRLIISYFQSTFQIAHVPFAVAIRSPFESVISPSMCAMFLPLLTTLPLAVRVVPSFDGLMYETTISAVAHHSLGVTSDNRAPPKAVSSRVACRPPCATPPAFRCVRKTVTSTVHSPLPIDTGLRPTICPKPGKVGGNEVSSSMALGKGAI